MWRTPFNDGNVMKRAVGPLVDGRVRLRLLEERDLPQTLAWRNQDEIRRWFLSSDLIESAQHARWFARYLERDDDLVFMIDDLERLKRPVGQVSLYHIDWAAARAEFGRMMIGDPDARRRGLARQATALLIGAASAWGLRELYLECLEHNDAALAVYAACGFAAVSRARGVVRMERLLPMASQRGSGTLR
jgi:diamine N-acetyltransferase